MRKLTVVQKFDIATRTATTEKTWMSNAHRAWFHYANPNGLYKEWQSNCERITDVIDSKGLAEGNYFIYGSLSDADSKLSDIIQHLVSNAGQRIQRRVNPTYLFLACSLLREHISKQNEWLALKE